MSADGFFVSPTGKKTFTPLENNPEVFTSLVHDLGVSPELGFHDVYSLDDRDLLALVSRPALALIFIVPAPAYHAVRAVDNISSSISASASASEQSHTHSHNHNHSHSHDERRTNTDACADAAPVTWFRQTIGHACGLYALVHAVGNGEARSRYVEQGSLLDRLLKEAESLSSRDARAEVLYRSEELEEAHMRAARKGDTPAPAAEEPCGYHFITFVRGGDGHLWELEGASDGPIDRGALGSGDGDDMLSDGALDRGVRRFLAVAEGNLEFSIVALARAG